MLMLTLSETEDQPSESLYLEHSLFSISKWESIHEKPFFGREPMSNVETISYIQQMLLSDQPNSNWILRLEVADYTTINDYINGQHTATWFRESQNPKPSSEIVTSELIYYWMIGFQIPFEADRWNFNRLMTLIRICGVKQTKPPKMSKQAQAEEYRRLNALRREQLGTSG